MTDIACPIRFHDPRDPETGFLSNFHRAGFTLDGAEWPTVEHYYQAQKFAGTPPADPVWQESIRLAESPRQAKEMGRSTEHPFRPDWDTVKERVMLKALVAKFVQNPDLALRLYATRYRLVEASPDDAWWGEGPGKTGENRLGRLLVAIREALPEADHQNMLEYDDAGMLHALCEDAAWKVVCDLNFKHNTWFPRVGVNVLTSPFYGQSARPIAQKLQPHLGLPLATVMPWRSDEGTEGRPEGWTLQWYADTSPDSATLHQGYTVRGAVTHRLARWPLLGRLAPHLPLRFVIAEILRDAYYDPSRVSDEIVEAYYAPTRSRNGLAAFVARARRDTIDRSSIVNTIRVPTLIVTGEVDRLVPLSVARRYGELIDGSRSVIVKEASHVAQEERPDAVLQAIEDWLGTLAGGDKTAATSTAMRSD